MIIGTKNNKPKTQNIATVKFVRYIFLKIRDLIMGMNIVCCATCV